MRKSTDLDSLAVLEEVAPRGFGRCSDTPIVILRPESAGNDATCEAPAITRDGVEPWTQHARAANGFGDVAANDTAPSARPTSYEMYHAARAHRSLMLGGIIVAAIQAARAIARRARARHQQGRQARANYDAFRRLDDHTLRDLGFHRSEISSVAAEVTGRAEYARVRALPTLHSLP